VSKKPKSKQPKPIVKVPKGKLGRAVFAGSQVAGALAVTRAIRDARTRRDRLALLHGALSAATLVVTALIALRTVRAETGNTTTAADSAEPPLLVPADR